MLRVHESNQGSDEPCVELTDTTTADTDTASNSKTAVRRRIIIDGCPAGDVACGHSSAPRPDADRTPPPRSHHNIDTTDLDQTVHPMSPLDQSKLIRETMQAYQDIHGKSSTTWTAEAAASAYIYIPESRIYPDNTNIVSPIATKHAIRDHDDCQVVGCTNSVIYL